MAKHNLPALGAYPYRPDSADVENVSGQTEYILGDQSERAASRCKQ